MTSNLKHFSEKLIAANLVHRMQSRQLQGRLLGESSSRFMRCDRELVQCVEMCVVTGTPDCRKLSWCRPRRGRQLCFSHSQGQRSAVNTINYSLLLPLCIYWGRKRQLITTTGCHQIHNYTMYHKDLLMHQILPHLPLSLSLRSLDLD